MSVTTITNSVRTIASPARTLVAQQGFDRVEIDLTFGKPCRCLEKSLSKTYSHREAGICNRVAIAQLFPKYCFNSAFVIPTGTQPRHDGVKLTATTDFIINTSKLYPIDRDRGKPVRDNGTLGDRDPN